MLKGPRFANAGCRALGEERRRGPLRRRSGGFVCGPLRRLGSVAASFAVVARTTPFFGRGCSPARACEEQRGADLRGALLERQRPARVVLVREAVAVKVARSTRRVALRGHARLGRQR